MRTPTYTRDGRHRIVSMPNGQWEMQSAHDKGKKDALPHNDGWDRPHRPTTREEAIRQLGNRGAIE
jgi:hypothetical protein